MKVTLHPLPVSPGDAADRVYEVRLAGTRVGEVVRDDIDPYEAGGARHLWHAYLDPFGGTEDWNWSDAVGVRTYTRRDAVLELLGELVFTAARLGVVLPGA